MLLRLIQINVKAFYQSHRRLSVCQVLKSWTQPDGLLIFSATENDVTMWAAEDCWSFQLTVPFIYDTAADLRQCVTFH